MARARRLLLGSLVLFGIIFAAWAVAWREPDPWQARIATTAELARELDAWRARLRIPGMSAAVAEGDRVIWAQGFGLADVERSVQARADTIYHLASVTKPFGATVILQLVEEHRLRLDAPVSDFGIVMERSAPVRVWHLLSHTSRDPPGAAYRYDGNAFGKLDAVIERVTGRRFAAELADRIIRPLGLKHTAPNPRDPELILRTHWAWLFGIPPMTPADRARARAPPGRRL